jgi:hypothetical protein
VLLKIWINLIFIQIGAGQVQINTKSVKFLERSTGKFSRLSHLAGSILSIPVTFVGLEREFSGAGLVIQERKADLIYEQLDNILLIRSAQKYEHFFKQVCFIYLYITFFYQ